MTKSNYTMKSNCTLKSNCTMKSTLSNPLSPPLQSSPRLRLARRSPQQRPQGHPAKSKFLATAVVVFALAGAVHGANIAITAVTVNDSTNGDRNIPVDTTSFQHASTLVDFTAGGTNSCSSTMPPRQLGVLDGIGA